MWWPGAPHRMIGADIAGAEVLVAGITAAQPCPHPKALHRSRVVVSNGTEFQALCGRCFSTLAGMVADKERGKLILLEKVRSIMLELGYTQADADEFWRSLSG